MLQYFEVKNLVAKNRHNPFKSLGKLQKQKKETKIFWLKVAIIVLNWNGWRDTIECLESLQRLTYPNYQIIVVDNGSTDDSVEKIRSWARDKFGLCRPDLPFHFGNSPLTDASQLVPQVLSLSPLIVILTLKQNLGFTGGNNVGTEYALSGPNPAEFVFLLNNDARPEQTCIKACIEVAQKENAAVVGAVIKDEKGDKVLFAGSKFPKELFMGNRNSSLHNLDEYWYVDIVGWVIVSNVVIPIFVYLDRFLIGSLITISAVAYYTAPYELITRLLIIPTSIATVLFPAFSSIASCGDRDELNVSVMRSTKYLLTAMVPPTVVFLIFAEGILKIWLGRDFAIESAGVFRLLSLAVLLNAIGYIPFALIQGIGRPDVVAKYHLIELPIYAGVAFFLITELGITGAALAWCLRMVWTIPIFFVICTKIAGIHLKALLENGVSRSLAVAAGLLMTSIAFALWSNWENAITGLLVGALLIGYVLLTWYITFDVIDKNLMKRLISETYVFLFERGGR